MKGGYLSGTERRGSLWTCRVEGAREYKQEGGGWVHGGEEGRAHT